MRISPDDYRGLDLRAHELLRDVPLHDVSGVDLPGGGPGRTLADVRAVEKTAKPSRVVGALFGLRLLLGRAFGWDREPITAPASLLSRLSDDDRRRSEVPPGTRVGGFLLLYQLPGEALLEIRNRTVHGWVCAALVPTVSGYRLYLAVYVRPVSWITRPYLAAIEPFRRLLYPLLLGRIRRAWIAAMGSTPGVSTQPPRAFPPRSSGAGV